MDQQVLERLLPSKEEKSFEDFSDDSFDLRDFQPYLHMLPEKEQDLLYMYHSIDKKQKEIANFFNVSQGAISHRLTRAKVRLKFIRDMPKISDEELLLKLKEHISDMDLRIVYHMVHTTCQSATAVRVSDELGLKGKERLTQVKVRHKFFKARDLALKLSESDPSFELIYKLLLCISENPYMLWEVKLPHFDRGSNVDYDDGVY